MPHKEEQEEETQYAPLQVEDKEEDRGEEKKKKPHYSPKS